MKIVDTKGERCPKPIIETKKAFKEANAGETFIVITDNKSAFVNISRFLSDNKIKFSASEKSGVWEFEVTKETGEGITTPAEDYCNIEVPAGKAAGYAMAISSELMGQGDDDLGRKLMKSFFVALSVLDELPSTIAFYNSGVKLTIRESEVIDILHEVENKGVEIIICGTCVDHYKLGDKINVGHIGDMYTILEKLSSAGNVIRP
jgi:selenium metabolism protein YedF